MNTQTSPSNKLTIAWHHAGGSAAHLDNLADDLDLHGLQKAFDALRQVGVTGVIAPAALVGTHPALSQYIKNGQLEFTITGEHPSVHASNDSYYCHLTADSLP